MQIKTINKTITEKLNEWIDTIEDSDLRTLVKNNTLLSGGSIASMLLNTDVNDYDVYIQDMDVLLKLTNYYVKDYSGIEVLDGRERDVYLHRLKEAYQSENIVNSYAIAVRNLKRNQIKLFFDSEKGGKRVNEDKNDLKYKPVFFSPNAISLSNDIQIVIRFNGNAEEIHKTFDYIHATNYFTFSDGLVTNVKALESLITKQLHYQGSMYPLTSIIRMKKFIKRGWNINAGEILKIMFQISELNLKDPDVLEEQLIGVDIVYFDTLIEVLRGVEPNKMNSNYVNKIIDKVFNEYEENDNSN